MRMRKALIPIFLAYAVISLACVYIVLPEGLDAPTKLGIGSGGWSALATNITKTTSGNLRVEFTIRNDTGDWSAMNSIENKPAILTSAGKDTNCDSVFVSTGGHRIAPGFQMRGYIAGTKAENIPQLIYVECTGSEAATGSILTIPYSYVTGQYNYYEQDKNKVDAKLEINLDEVKTDLVYPIAEAIEGLIQQSDIKIVAINKVDLSLTSVQRGESNFQFDCKTNNPGEYATYVHIGNPPVIGEDGILYGFYQTPDIISAPITPAGGTADWMTDVAVPKNVKGFYILLSVETGKARLFANYVIDITDQ